MNRPARRDGTPEDNRDRGASRGAPRDDRRGAPRGDSRGGAARNDRSDNRAAAAPRGDSRGGAPRGDFRNDSRGGDNRGGAPRGDSRGGAPRGDSRGAAPRGDSRGGAPRGDFRSDSRGGAPRGDNRGAPRDDRFGGAPRGDFRNDSRGGTPRGDNRGGAGAPAPRQRPEGATTDVGPGSGRPGKAPKPQKKIPVKATLSFAKPAKYQGEGPAATSFTFGDANSEGMRLQKVLAQAGVASRRAAELLIDEGRVEVDGEIVRHQGKRIDPTKSVVRVDGVRIVIDEEKVYLALNKPKGWQSTMSDDMNRPCIGDIVAERVMSGQRLFHVGRLDADTEGLILLTNDGELAHRLMHPSFEIMKTYMATVNGMVPKNLERQMHEGVELEDGPVKVDKFEILEVFEGKSLVRVVLHEGRKHIVRRLLDEVGFPVVQLVRTDVGPIHLAEQRPGSLRVLGRGEISNLYDAVGL